MYNQNRLSQYKIYNDARNYLSASPDILVELERFFAFKVNSLLLKNKESIKKDYDEASYTYPFWQNYPPDSRGRQPRGDQYPWIEVGEHSVGRKFSRHLTEDFSVYDIGVPTGADERFLLKSPEIYKITNGLSDSVFLSIDIKSVGPRDDAHHAVMSHNQISGDGIWENIDLGVKNTPLIARGIYAQHEFHCSLPPIYVLSDKTIAPVITMAVKPVYDMLSLRPGIHRDGQPLKRISIASIPNGILLLVNPNYMGLYPGLLYPGKDDKGKNPLKVRARVDFSILQKINSWRYSDIHFL
ncbi:BglI family type II restriction endonuclease [Pectobacterium punjabense]|uniref:BglI family type II restriction endonuclease n=1 Tax=Pectobacterium punjabense TaxID=2108399 RepID=UPI002B246D16|nr:BglI family type II restriction endonuclease [Pectobacterium punjabense]